MDGPVADIHIRPAEDADAPAIGAVLTAAFGGPAEAALVADLHRRADCWSLVATQGDSHPAGADANIVGVVTFSPVQSRPENPALRAVGLAPLAVQPDLQRHGIGSMLVGSGLAECRRRGVGLVVVLGHARYYPRFGFKAAAAIGMRCKWSHDDESFMYVELVPEHAALVGSFVDYLPEFDAF